MRIVFGGKTGRLRRQPLKEAPDRGQIPLHNGILCVSVLCGGEYSDVQSGIQVVLMCGRVRSVKR